MNSASVRPVVIWALLGMEAGLVLPIISGPARGAEPGPAGPLLLLLLLPLGYVAVRRRVWLDDPARRLAVGIALTLGLRLAVVPVPHPLWPSGLVWLFSNIVAGALGIGLWWRGGALAHAELTPAEVRTEFVWLGGSLLALLVVFRPYLLADATLLAVGVGLFVVAGLLAVSLARQDAAEASPPAGSRGLGTVVALLPAGASLLLVGALRPSVASAIWSSLGALLEVLLAPFLGLLAWLASLVPNLGAGAPGLSALRLSLRPPPRLDAAPGVAPPVWLAWLLVLALALAAGLATVLVVRLLLASRSFRLPHATAASPATITVEPAGDARHDARLVLGWLLRWLRRWLARPPRPRSAGPDHARAAADALDAWAAYRALLDWADRHGARRRPAETTQQFGSRLVRQVPDSAEIVDLVTRTFEWERYGDVRPSLDRLRRLERAVRALHEGSFDPEAR